MMIQTLKVFVIKSGDLSLIPSTNIIEGKSDSQNLYFDFYTGVMARMCPLPQHVYTPNE